MSAEFRYLWCDSPSPAHAALETWKELRASRFAEGEALAKRVSAETCAFRHCVEGFFFSVPPEGWKVEGVTEKGEKYFAPVKKTKEGKALAKEMKAIIIPSQETLLHSLELHRMVFRKSGRVSHSTIGWKDERIYIRIPVATGDDDGDKGAFSFPSYLTECKEWEMQRWFAEGREACTAAEQQGGAK